MKRILLALFVFLALPALADDMIASNGRDSVRLTQAECHADVLPVVAAAFAAQAELFRAAYATVGGAEWRACWVLRPDGMILMIYSDADAGLIPLRDFRRVPSI